MWDPEPWSPEPWSPEPGWQALPGGSGPSTYGVWLATEGGRRVVVKRLVPPRPGDPPELLDQRHFAYWRREAEVALSRAVEATPGLRAAGPTAVSEDADGVTLRSPYVPEAGSSGLFLARALGRFAGAALPDAPWLAHGQLRSRLLRVERRGGWPTLARTTVADVADHLWSHREKHLAALEALPEVPLHGDPTPQNLPGREGDDALGVDWGSLGRGPVGSDLGYLALSAREELEHLLEAHLDALPAGVADRDQVLLGARVTVVYTALSRAEWVLARAAEGEGALAGKFRHPSVAPYLLSLQRQFPHLEALLG